MPLNTNAQLAAVPLEPSPDQVIASDGSPEGNSVALTWSAQGGLLQALSDEVGIDPGCAVAVLCVESGGQGFGADGRMIIRFENQIFRDQWGGANFGDYFAYTPGQSWLGHQWRSSTDQAWTACHGSQASEWEVLEFARSLDDAAALSSISMGAPQIMGFNHAAIGYDTVQEMFERFQADVRYQIIGQFDFLSGGGTTSPMLDALRARDFRRFASHYNGTGQEDLYGGRIQRHVERFNQLRGGGGAASSGGSYVVSPGDSLGAIAARFGVSMEALQQANGITDPNQIAVGQSLRIP